MSATMPAVSFLKVLPLASGIRKDTWIGAEVFVKDNAIIEPDRLTDNDVNVLRQALYENSVLVIKRQQGIDPLALEKLAAIWDDSMINVHSAGKDQVRDPRSILSRNNGARLPTAPNVQVIGNGKFDNYEGLRLDLRHVDSAEFHAEHLSKEELANGQTRFYRWHQDAPLYESLPGKVTLIHALVVPELDEQNIAFDGEGMMSVQAGSTASLYQLYQVDPIADLISGARAFELLSPKEKEFALHTTVQYAPRAYEWIRDCKATSDGLGIAKVGDERDFADLPAWSWDKVQEFPMAWRNPGKPGQPHLQILGCCVHSLRTKDPRTGKTTIIDDLAEVRKICYQLQKRSMRPQYIYAHKWEAGDLVIFHNYGVWHSITGQLGDTKRLMWQVTMRSGREPEPWKSP